MNQERWEQVNRLYHAALEAGKEERIKLLEKSCGADAELRAEVEALLAMHEAADGFMENPAIEEEAKNAAEEPPSLVGRRLGPYQILGLLGIGGMGEVYHARDTRLDRMAALKILPAEVSDDSSRLQRFVGEAKSASALNHPNIATIYEIGESDGIHWIAMELIEGQTLAQRMKNRPLGIEEILEIGLATAEGLEAAHKKGIIHRDIKPANLMLTPEGRVKILDFGLAKVIETGGPVANPSAVATVTAGTEAGLVLGTLGYMSPEQMRGLTVDHRTDLFSFGVVLYEMVSGQRPFTGSSSIALADAILHAPPRDLGDRPVPGALKSLIWKLLEKEPADRCGSAEEVLRELKALEASLSPSRPARISRKAWLTIGAVAVLTCIAFGWLWHRSSRERWALETATPEIERLVEAREFVKAAALAREARALLPKDQKIEKLWRQATGEVSIASQPPEAEVSIRPYGGDPNVWETLGNTPLNNVRVPRTTYIWRLVKPGYAPMFFIGEPPGAPAPGAHSRFIIATLKLRPEGSVPPEMLVVSGDKLGLTWPVSEAPWVKIDDFLIDRHEVTNEEYKKFVDAGGYQKREFWKQPFVKDGKKISWEEAVAFFRDGTGRPGPATWEAGSYPKGKEQHPVAGVSWYEAAAYAEYAGKSLPTAYHWMLASQAEDSTAVIAVGSNFQSEGTWPVGSRGALSGSGTTDMAGNVKEWCLNEGRDGLRFIMGGGFGEPAYMFNYTDEQSPWDRRPNFGFRCVKLDSPPTTAAAAHIEVAPLDFKKEKPISGDVFNAYTAMYGYDKGELNARVEETETTESWIREKVSFDAAYGHERVTAHLFLPRHGTPPFQTVVYFPGGFAMLDDKLDLAAAEANEPVDFVLKSGRAVIFPIYKGFYERRDGLVPGGQPLAFFRDHVIMWSKDLGRTLDYLETRKDIDSKKVGYYGFSLGGIYGPLLAVIEKRIKVMIFSSGGFLPQQDLPEVHPLNFVPHVTIPVLMINGRYDQGYPVELSQLPFFRNLGTPAKDKKHIIYEGGHGVFPRPEAVRECLDWLDKYLGPVRRA